MMETAGVGMRRETAWPAVLQQAFRLFFLGAAWSSVLYMSWWGAGLATGRLSMPGNPFLWHGYHMIFGFGIAVVIGFLLTAASNWTGRRLVTPPQLLALFLLWAFARVVGLMPAILPGVLASLADALALWGATAALAIGLVRSGNRRNYRFAFILGGVALAATSFALAELGMIPDLRYPMLRGALDLLLVLMIVMGQRIIPFFTDRRLPQLGVRQSALLSVISPVTVIAGLLFYYLGLPVPAMAAILAGAVSLVMQLTLWKSWGTLREPMLWILHVGYLWLAIAMVLRAGSIGYDWMPYSTAGHAVSAGALGALGLGMLARVALGHTGRPIRANGAMVVAFLLVTIAPIFRLLTGFGVEFDMRLLFGLAALCWIVAWLIYAVAFLPVLTSPRVDGRPG